MSKVIVIAWTARSGLRETDRLEQFDGVNWRRKMEWCDEGHACVFSRDLKDEPGAREFMAREGLGDYRAVYVLDDTANVLQRARDMVLRERKANQ